MRYYCISIDTTVEAEDVVAFALSEELGIDTVEFSDNAFVDDSEKEGGFFPELQPDGQEDDGTAKVLFYLPVTNDSGEKTDIEGLSASLREVLSTFSERCRESEGAVDPGALSFSVSVCDDADWRDKWKEYFHAFLIDDLLIRPSWERAEDEPSHTYEIEIDPGISFGTGAHESTYLAIQGIQRYLEKGARFLDIGTGSGILSIAAFRYGAKSAVMTDIDPDCMKTAEENLLKNGIDAEAFRGMTGNIAEDDALCKEIGEGLYDICAANILADIIIPMAPKVYPILREGGIFITSGIINTRETDVKEALEKAGFVIKETKARGEWVSVICEKEAADGNIS